MTNNKTKKNKKNNKNKARKRVTQQVAVRKTRPNLAPLIRSVCSITDPFCEAAIGAKFPDARAAKSLAFTFRARTSVVADSNGRGAIFFLPGFTFTNASPATLASDNNATYTLLGSSMFPNFAAANISGYRINSIGVRLKNMTTPLNSGGIVRIRGLGAKYGTSFAAIDYGSYNYDYSEDIPLQDLKDTCIFLRKLDETSEFFVNPATTNPTGNVVDWISPGWGAATFCMTGCTAGASIDVQYYINYELTFTDDSSTSLLMTPAKPANTLLTQASAAITNRMNPIITGGIKRAEKYVADNAMGYITKALGAAVGGYFGGPRGAVAGFGAAGSLVDGPMEVD